MKKGGKVRHVAVGLPNCLQDGRPLSHCSRSTASRPTRGSRGEPSPGVPGQGYRRAPEKEVLSTSLPQRAERALAIPADRPASVPHQTAPGRGKVSRRGMEPGREESRGKSSPSVTSRPRPKANATPREPTVVFSGGSPGMSCSRPTNHTGPWCHPASGPRSPPRRARESIREQPKAVVRCRIASRGPEDAPLVA